MGTEVVLSVQASSWRNTMATKSKATSQGWLSTSSRVTPIEALSFSEPSPHPANPPPPPTELVQSRSSGKASTASAAELEFLWGLNIFTLNSYL